MPWRTNRDPYRIVVSEFMLQQTQVDRVVPLFEAFVARWSDFATLAAASRADVVRAWQGLGYNSRALRLHELSRAVMRDFGGRLPSDTHELRALPGVGAYTAGAIRAFAFDLDDVALDTNVRRVVHRVRLGIETPPKATMREVDALARSMVTPGYGYAWNSATMDLGATICTARAPKCLLCPLSSECVAAPIDPEALARAQRAVRPAKAERFADTDRFVRGRIIDRLRALPPGACVSLLDLAAGLPARPFGDVERIVGSLVRDGLVCVDGDEPAYRLADG